MAPVNGRPFLGYLLDYLNKQRCTRVILSLGYKHKVVIDWLDSQEELPFEMDYIVESEPLGTGGGIQAAIEEAAADNVAVVNGDTLFLADIGKQMAFHYDNKASVTLALKKMHDFDRYGVVKTDESGIITAFEEKAPTKEGYINGGVYVINREAFLKKNLPEKFSFEQDYLERFVGEKKFFGYNSDNYFIDIGVPADYEKAAEDFKTLFP
jgi:D-glycero-alpha-D-manno-heptose 1-phosphate guanylyltransferase